MLDDVSRWTTQHYRVNDGVMTTYKIYTDLVSLLKRFYVNKFLLQIFAWFKSFSFLLQKKTTTMYLFYYNKITVYHLKRFCIIITGCILYNAIPV